MTKDWHFPDMAKLDIKLVKEIRVRPTRYTYHGKDENNRTTINHGTGQRNVMEIPGTPWPYESPELCEEDSTTGDWYESLSDGRQYLLCRGCGVDCT